MSKDCPKPRAGGGRGRGGGGGGSVSCYNVSVFWFFLIRFTTFFFVLNADIVFP